MIQRLNRSNLSRFGRADHFAPDTKTSEAKRVEALEMFVVEFFHRDFLSLLGALKQCDKYHIGVVTQHEFKEAVQRVLGHGMSEHQWSVLKEDVGLDPDGLVPYVKFLEQFSNT